MSRMMVGVTPITISMIFESSSMPKAMKRIGSTESAMILSKNRMNRRKNVAEYGKQPHVQAEQHRRNQQQHAPGEAFGAAPRCPSRACC